MRESWATTYGVPPPEEGGSDDEDDVLSAKKSIPMARAPAVPRSLHSHCAPAILPPAILPPSILPPAWPTSKEETMDCYSC